MTVDLLRTGPVGAGATVLLAHGAGAAMDSPAMTAIASALGDVGFAVVRFEFAYMAARRQGARKPPPRAETLIPEYLAAIEAAGVTGPLIVGGKSMGGRVASLLADDLHGAGRIAGLLCVGYPFHPPGKPEALRTAHLETLRTPALICQGTRDPFGSAEEVGGYTLSPKVALHWLEDGDHDLKPRKRVTGKTLDDHMAEMARAAADWAGKPGAAPC